MAAVRFAGVNPGVNSAFRAGVCLRGGYDDRRTRHRGNETLRAALSSPSPRSLRVRVSLVNYARAFCVRDINLKTARVIVRLASPPATQHSGPSPGMRDEVLVAYEGTRRRTKSPLTALGYPPR